MPKVLITTKHLEDNYSRIYSAIDNKWLEIFHILKLTPILIPNNFSVMKSIIQSIDFDYILLTGGGDITQISNIITERDKIEKYLINLSLRKNIPLLGICRGMQQIQDTFGDKLELVINHANTRHEIEIFDKDIKKIMKNNIIVNSYHNYGCFNSIKLKIIARSKNDCVIEMISYKSLLGIMYHPERESDIKKSASIVYNLLNYEPVRK